MSTPQPPTPDGNETPRTLLRLLGAFAAPVIVYLLAWEGVARGVLPGVDESARGLMIHLFSVLIPCLGVLASIAIAGVKAGRMLGGGVMAVFFLTMYTASGVAFGWLPVGLTLLGIALAWGLGRLCPTMSPDLSTAFHRARH
ncbi:hypothetical protein [Halomonas sp. YLGW01]|uniref:hypothetical protein n=1 Tax=Halomonas sp. YLGW01 TaxID=2773308 RepID=UPI0017869741|nr:hypothetical protein [Halomonas sp. YLGW01]